ncbi:hypothetical protein Ahy_B01g054597 [Arachis hypogaea]|uniref:Uncharacterized protein n=1 Tax=Arachis hypogaea TaxID=3818 RepID=A0A445AU12_ARAHY|nr:hypothetical protein Ahy_B01g054597 [Arachis hypogaea]
MVPQLFKSILCQVPADKKLPSLSLLDSIVKNFGQEYVKHFSLRIPQVGQLEHGQLGNKQSKIFPPSVLSNIEAQLQSSPTVNNQQSFANHLRAYDFRGPILGAHVGGDRLDSMGTVGDTREERLNE